MTTTQARSSRLRSSILAALLGLGSITSIAACSDEDGDGGTTDEEIEDGKETVDSIGEEIEEEIDSQNEGDNEDDE